MPSPRQRLRITFAKGDAVRYSSHLDLARAWARSLRRAGAPLAYSQGFNPRPRIQLAAALPLGHTGGAELLDAWFERPVVISEFRSLMPGALPDGLTVSDVQEAPLSEPALQNQVTSAEYRVAVEWEDAGSDVEERIAGVLEARELPTERRGKRYDLRPMIEQLWCARVDAGQVVLGMQLSARQGRTGRAEDVLGVLGMDGAFARCHRARLILSIG